MKYLILILLVIGCTKKYETYHVIDKYNFSKESYQAPITGKLYPGRKRVNSTCEGQVFFSSNAKKKTDKAVENMVRYLCPNSQYLLNSKITEIWWTTIVYSRSCVEIETYCPRK